MHNFGAVALLFSAACASQPAAPAAAPSAARETTSTSSTAAAPPHGHGMTARNWSLPKRVIDGKKGGVLEPEAFFEDLISARVIYVSEQHNNPHHHAAQLSVIAGVWARDRSLAIGMEMFKRPFQKVIDEWLAGQISDEELVARTEWDDRWGYSFELYLPILEFARAHHIPVHALNAPDEITRTVAGGGVAALSEVERASLPDLDLGNEEHRALLREVYEGHHGHGMGTFDDFYAAQVIWDETMAYEIARVLQAAEGPHRIIVLAGDGHVRFGLGIPDRAARRGAVPYRTVLPVMRRELDDTLEASAGDYLWVMAMSEKDLPGE